MLSDGMHLDVVECMRSQILAMHAHRTTHDSVILSRRPNACAHCLSTLLVIRSVQPLSHCCCRIYMYICIYIYIYIYIYKPPRLALEQGSYAAAVAEWLHTLAPSHTRISRQERRSHMPKITSHDSPRSPRMTAPDPGRMCQVSSVLFSLSLSRSRQIT
jgi:hypothetical protein